MSTNKTQIDHAAAESFMRERFHVLSIDQERIADGETSQAFFFETHEGQRVLRVNAKNDFGFRKDQFAHAHFNSDAVPIPKIFDIGEIQAGVFFAVSERMPGKTLDKFTHAEIDNLMPKIISTVDAIHAIAPPGKGYGTWDLNGQGKFTSWREMIKADLHQDDAETTSADFYDSALAESLRNEIMAMFDVIPEERKLIHRDYGFNNTLSDGVNITGVIDWEGSAYGDPLQDVAWLDFWHNQQGYAKAFKRYYSEQGRDMPQFNERVTCYKLLAGCGSLDFFARSRQPKKYEDTKGIVARIKR